MPWECTIGIYRTELLVRFSQHHLSGKFKIRAVYRLMKVQIAESIPILSFTVILYICILQYCHVKLYIHWTFNGPFMIGITNEVYSVDIHFISMDILDVSWNKNGYPVLYGVNIMRLTFILYIFVFVKMISDSFLSRLSEIRESHSRTQR